MYIRRGIAKSIPSREHQQGSHARARETKLHPTIIQPSEAVQSLVDDVLVLALLVPTKHSPTHTFDPQRIDVSAVTLSCGILQIEEFDPDQCAQVLFEESCKPRLQEKCPLSRTWWTLP